MLKAAKEESEDSPFWHSTFLFQLADLYLSLGELVSFQSTLARGVKYCEKSCAPVAQLYFLLMQFLHLSRESKYKEAAALSADLFSRLEKLQHPACTILKASHHTISLLSGLQLGKILTYKVQLKELQLFAREISHSNTPDPDPDSSPSPDNFMWIQRDNLFQLVYLISMLHPMLSGATDRAIGYADKALQLISQQTEILLDQPWDGISGENIPKTLADQFKSLVLHNLCVCHIVKGSLSEVPPLLKQTEVLHTRSIDPLAHHMLTGLYLFGQDRYKLALSHFNLVLDTPRAGAPPQDVFLQVQALIHICICYVKLGSYDSDAMTEKMSRLKSLRTNQLPTEALNLNAATNFVIGLHQALLQSLPEAKSALKEAVVLANTEDLHKLVACTLILLGKVFMAIGKQEEAGTMIPPAFQLANKIQDTDLQIWAATLMAEFLQSAGDDVLQRETLSTRQIKLAKREQELKQVQGLEDGAISMGGWVDGVERLMGSQENSLQHCETEEVLLKSPLSPDAKRVRMGHPLTPLKEDNRTDNFIMKQEINEKEMKAKVTQQNSDITNRQETPKPRNQLITPEISNDRPLQPKQANNHAKLESTEAKEQNSSQCSASSIPNNVYTAAPHIEQTPPMNGTHSYQSYMEESVYNSPAFQQTAPLNVMSESPLKHSVRLSQQDSIIYREPRNVAPQLSADPSYQLGGRLTNQASLPSDIPLNHSYYQQPNEVSRYQPGTMYQQVLSQGSSHPSPVYSPQTLGIRLLDQGEWTSEENEISIPLQQHMPPMHPLMPEASAARYQHIQQLTKQASLSRQQKPEMSAAPGDIPQNMHIPLEALTNNRYRQIIPDLLGQNVSLDSFQSRQVPVESMPDQGYLRQSAFDMQPNMEPRLPTINSVPSRQPFKLQNLLQSAPSNVLSPDKLALSHNKRPRLSPPPSHPIDPINLPYKPVKPIGMPSQGLLNPLMLQSYPQQLQGSPCRQQSVPINPALQSLYGKNMAQSFGQYFIPQTAQYIFPPGGVYPPSQYQVLEPNRLQIHPQNREK